MAESVLVGGMSYRKHGKGGENLRDIEWITLFECLLPLV